LLEPHKKVKGEGCPTLVTSFNGYNFQIFHRTTVFLSVGWTLQNSYQGHGTLLSSTVRLKKKPGTTARKECGASSFHRDVVESKPRIPPFLLLADFTAGKQTIR
jgi:hypothetical protein